MANGFALGGAAQGLRTALSNDIQRQGLAQQKSLGEQELSIRERQLKQTEQQGLVNQAEKAIAEEVSVIGEIIKAGKQAGESPEKIAGAIEPLLESVDRVGQRLGKDTTALRARVKALLQAPATSDPKEQLQVEKLQREKASDVAELENVIVSADAALNALDTIKSIPGADIFLTTPGLIEKTRTALGVRDALGGPIGSKVRDLVSALPKQVSTIPVDQLETVLEAAQTVEKQQNAIAQGVANQAGTAGLKSRLEALGAGASLNVQSEVFKQAREITARRLERIGETIEQSGSGTSDEGRTISTGPLPLPEKKSELVKGQVYDLPDGRQALWNGKKMELLN